MLADTCSFHAFQKLVIILDVPETYRMILTLLYLFLFSTEFGLRIHTSAKSRRFKPAPEHLLYQAETLLC